jgi:hypothetical protein
MKISFASQIMEPEVEAVVPVLPVELEADHDEVERNLQKMPCK